jgi:non-canonical (house-cleaning) NTP pyrophosphatase
MSSQPIAVAVGSLRTPKLRAVSAALDSCVPFFEPGAHFEIVGFEVASGVRSTPLSTRDTMLGAQNRAKSLRTIAQEAGKPCQFFIGLEGGLETREMDGTRHVFLESWAYVLDLAGNGHFGQSGAIGLPDELARQVIDQGIDLSEAIDAFAGREGIRNGLGAWGILTCGLITREDAFRIATINAFAPFFPRQSRLAAP